MIFMATGGRCVVDYSALRLPLARDQVLAILARYGFQKVDVDLVERARMCSGVSWYHRGASIAQAPQIVDCSSFVKWLYAQRGIWLPRYAIQQRAYLAHAVEQDCLRVGDLVFASRMHGLYEENPSDRVGHVGMMFSNDTVIHASQDRGVRETFLRTFLKGGVWRGARRVISDPEQIDTFTIPEAQEIESSDDVRWLLALHLRDGKSIPRTVQEGEKIWSTSAGIG